MAEAKRSPMSRRSFLGVSGAATSMAILHPRARAAAGAGVLPVERLDTDVVVVGAGFAGLAAAHALHGVGVSVLVLEARDRVGGRAHDAILGGTKVGLGATWVQPGHDRVLDLARAAGVTTSAVGDGGALVDHRGGTRRVVGAGALAADHGTSREVAGALRRLNLMAAEVDPEAPWATSNAPFRDARALSSWSDDHLAGQASRALFADISRAVWGAEPSQVSLLHALFTMAASGGAGPLVNLAYAPGWQGPELVGREEAKPPPLKSSSCWTSRQGGRRAVSRPVGERRHTPRLTFEGGAQLVAERIAGRLGGRVRTGTPVRRVVYEGRGVTVEADGLVVEARRAVVAVPPSVLGAIEFAPTLPAPRQQLAGHMTMGGVVAVACVYESPFWTGEELPGHAVGGPGPLALAHAGSGNGGTGVVVGYARGREARRWASAPAAERREAALQSLKGWFGDRAGRPAAYHEHDWQADPWARGGWAAFVPPGVWTSLGAALHDAVGPLHWAGAETSPAWPGRLEGAVRSGERAAAEVVQALRKSSPVPALGGVLP